MYLNLVSWFLLMVDFIKIIVIDFFFQISGIVFQKMVENIIIKRNVLYLKLHKQIKLIYFLYDNQFISINLIFMYIKYSFNVLKIPERQKNCYTIVY